MNPQLLKDLALFLAEKLKDKWPSKMLFALLASGITFAFTHDSDHFKETLKAQGKIVVTEIVKPSIDSVKDTIVAIRNDMKDLKADQQAQAIQQQAFFGALMQVIPGLKAEVRKLGEQTRATEAKKQENGQLLDALREAGQ